MDSNIAKIIGNWDIGYSLDKHTLRSTPAGHNEYGHMLFDTVRTPIGEALYQLKYRSDYSQVDRLADQMIQSFNGLFPGLSIIVPMPPSRYRARQPVIEIAREYSRRVRVPCVENLLIKTSSTPPMKDIATKEEKIAALVNAFAINDVLSNGQYNALIIDDLFDTGSSLEAATQILRTYGKIGRVYVATVTRKR